LTQKLLCRLAPLGESLVCSGKEKKEKPIAIIFESVKKQPVGKTNHPRPLYPE
jgi:hypothetical protein